MNKTGVYNVTIILVVSIDPGNDLVQSRCKPSPEPVMTKFPMSCDNIYRLVQERRNSSVLVMELRLSCTDPLTWGLTHSGQDKMATIL